MALFTVTYGPLYCRLLAYIHLVYKVTTTLSLTGCLEDVEKVLSVEPDNVGVLTNKGIALYELNKVDDAMAAFEAAKSKSKGSCILYFSLGVVCAGLVCST